jgi:hypothetical protein
MGLRWRSGATDQLSRTVMLTDSVTDCESDVHVALKLAVNSLPSNAEYVVALRLQSGRLAVAASQALMTESSALWNWLAPWNGIVPAFWQGIETKPEMHTDTV